MRLPNLLTTRHGRLIAFFLLYVTEGIPLGFAATAVAAQLKRQGVGATEIGAFVASFYLPWAFKWAFGPIIDVIAIPGLGRRRGWILVTQVLMALTLLSTVVLQLPGQLWLFTVILLIHNTFGAMQDVAIDALACTTLAESERGVANGVMFAGAYTGIMLGGSGVLFVAGAIGFQSTFFVVAAAILAVTVLVVLPMREPDADAPASGGGWRRIGSEMHAFALTAFRSFFRSRGAFAAVFFALLPTGAMCLGLPLFTNLAVDLGLSDDQVAWLGLWSQIIAAAFCVLGGYLSDRFGRRRLLFVYALLVGLPVLYLAAMLGSSGWSPPKRVEGAPAVATALVAAPAALVTVFWVATLIFSVFQGLMYGTRTAIFMDVTNQKVAATQFTAYMALMNVTIAYSSAWQGVAVDSWGYVPTMYADVLLGLLCLLFIPFLARRVVGRDLIAGDRAPRRARIVALLLGLTCLAWLPVRFLAESLGALSGIASTLFTLVFIGSAVYLLAAAAMLYSSARAIAVSAIVVAPFLLLMQIRHSIPEIAAILDGFVEPAVTIDVLECAVRVVPLVAGVLLLVLVAHPWREILERDEDVDAVPHVQA